MSGMQFASLPKAQEYEVSKWVKLPPFTRERSQLSKLEVDKARDLSQVRIHVERIIDAVRQKYSVLLGKNILSCSQLYQ